MRSNPVKAALARGEHVFGAMLFEAFTPGMPAILAGAGAQFIMFDMEHTAIGFDTIKTQLALCRGLPIVPMVRVPNSEYHFIARVLDAGAMGIMVPMVETREQTEAIVAATRYPPIGRRGAAFGFAHDDYAPGNPADKIRAAHERTMVIPMIETGRGVENLDAIATVKGIDALWLGHFDLTNFLGIPGEFDHPKYVSAVDAIIATCRRHNIAAGFMATDDQWARDYLAKGFRLMAAGLDQFFIRDAVKASIDFMRGCVQEGGTKR
jgi:2-keto-3-deoxy-L-rhamnonate aldolase RhmA